MKISFILMIMASLTQAQTNIQSIDTKDSTKLYDFYKQLYSKVEQSKGKASIDKEIPKFSKNIKKALEVSKKNWSDSVIYDELAKENILPKEILKKLGIPFKTTKDVLHVPAGVMHTYGYLFSQLETKYGKKSKRWIESRIDERMGLPAGTFSPNPPKGEFLENLTKELYRAVAGENPKAPQVGFIEEEVNYTNGKSVRVLTHFIQLLDLEDQKNEKLLVYQIQYKNKPAWFVTAFPVNELFFGEVKNSKAHDIEIFKPRYNWYVDPTYKVQAAHSFGYRDVSVNQSN